MSSEDSGNGYQDAGFSDPSNEGLPGPESQGIEFPADAAPLQATVLPDEPTGTLIGRIVDSSWACVLVPIFAVAAALIVGVIGFLVAAIMHNGLQEPIQGNPQTQMNAMLEDPVLFIIMMLPNQLTFLFFGVALAVFSNSTFRNRLGLRKGRGSLGTWLVYIAATPAVGIAISMIMNLLIDQESTNMQMVEDMIEAQKGSKLLIAIALIAIAPGICEEILFRGFSQHRLLKHWPAWVAILVSSVLFALAHVEPIHVMAVFPLGVWFGIIAWKTQSIIPCMICHFLNNLLSILALKFGLEEQGGESLLLGIAGVSGVFLIASIVLLIRPSRSPEIPVDIA